MWDIQEKVQMLWQLKEAVASVSNLIRALEACSFCFLLIALWSLAVRQHILTLRVFWWERDINQRNSHLRSSQFCPAISVLNHSAFFQAKVCMHGWVVCSVWKTFINWMKVNILKNMSALITLEVGAMLYGGMCHAITHEKHAYCCLHSVPTKGLRRAQYIFSSMSTCIAYKICCSCHSQVVFQMEDFVFVWSLWQQCLKWSALGCIMGISPPQCLLKTACCSPFSFSIAASVAPFHVTE